MIGYENHLSDKTLKYHYLRRKENCEDVLIFVGRSALMYTYYAKVGLIHQNKEAFSTCRSL